MKSNRIYLWEGIFLYLGKGIQSGSHNSHAFEIGMSLDGPVQANNENTKFQLMMIAPDYRHACSIPDVQSWAHIGIDSESYLAREFIKKYITNSGLVFLLHDSLSPFASQLKQALKDNYDISEAADLLFDFLSHLLGKSVSALRNVNHLDYRIVKVIDLLKNNQIGQPSLRELSEQVELSGGRLVHLFKEQVGIPIRKYMLWLRLQRAISEMSISADLTSAALKAGFSDSAHFSRIFLRVFGRPPSIILKNSQIIQDAVKFV